MDDTDTATMELTEREAREVVNALANYEVGASVPDEAQALDVERFLQREFGFEQHHSRADRDVADVFLETFGDSGRTVQFSRGEAVAVVRALDNFLGDVDPTEVVAVSDLGDRFREAFDIDDRRSA